VRVFSLFLLLAISNLSYAHDADKAPALGSWYKNLDKSVSACKLQSVFKVKDIGVTNIVENDFGIYGIYKGNRVVVKCMKQGENSTLLVMVAGSDHGSVEAIRNQLVKGII
jgi:hypothetical protein